MTDVVYAAVPKKLYTDYSYILKLIADPKLEMRTEGFIVLGIGFVAFLPSVLGVAEYTERENKEDTSKHGIYVAQSIFLTIAILVIVYGLFKIFMSFDTKQSPSLAVRTSPVARMPAMPAAMSM